MRRGFAYVLAAAITVSLSACTSDDSPTPQPTSTPAQTTTAPPTTQPPPSPPPAKRTPAGAEAFVRYFWQTYNYAYATLNPAPLTSISDKVCELCASAAKNVGALAQAGKQIQGAQVIVSVAVSPGLSKDEGVIVTTVVEQGAGTSTSSTGEVEEIRAVAKHRAYVGLWWEKGHWKVNGVSVEKSQP